jgi:hypothetical protein
VTLFRRNVPAPESVVTESAPLGGALDCNKYVSQQFGIPAGRAAALPADPEPEPDAEPVLLPELPELPEPVIPLVEEPVVLPDEDPLAAFLSRAMLVLTSQHWLDAEVEPEPEPEPVPCALAKLARPKSAAAETAARQSFFMDVSSFINRRVAGAPQYRGSSYVPGLARARMFYAGRIFRMLHPPPSCWRKRMRWADRRSQTW